MKLKKLKTTTTKQNKFPLTLLLLIHITLFALLFSLSFSTPSKYQVIWYEGFTVGTKPDYNFYYHLGMKYYQNNPNSFTDFTDNGLSNEGMKVRVTRDDESLYNEHFVEYVNDDNSNPADTNPNNRFRYFFPELDGSHRDGLRSVMWDITIGCGCKITYKIKYFKCDNDAQTYYDSLTNTNKKLRLSTHSNANEVIEVLPIPQGQFSSIEELRNALYNYLPCERETGNTADSDCCIPYACWLDEISNACICALDKSFNLYNGFGDDCWCSINSASQECVCAKDSGSVECLAFNR